MDEKWKPEIYCSGMVSQMDFYDVGIKEPLIVGIRRAVIM